MQGALGDCWFLSALGVVAMRPELLLRIFEPMGEEGGGEAGSVTVQLYDCLAGEWRRVTIDDRLPCGTDGKLLYAHSPSADELWVSLLEKARSRDCM